MMSETEARLHVLCDVLEVEVSVVSEYESRERDEQFGEWGMHVHKVLGLDVL